MTGWCAGHDFDNPDKPQDSRQKSTRPPVLQVYLKQNLAFLAVPKTGTTAIEAALRPHADIVFANLRKHTTAAQFQNCVAPFLHRFGGARPEIVAVMRHPVEYLRSWYRYRSRLTDPENPRTLGNVSFDAFASGVTQNPQPAFAAIRSQTHYLMLKDESIPIHHLFDYDEHDRIQAFFSERFQEDFEFPIRNVSPYVPTPLSEEVEQNLRTVQARDFELFERLREAGGYLRPLG